MSRVVDHPEEEFIATLYKLSKESKGLALWIPGRVVERLGLKPGDKVVMILHDGAIQLIPLKKLLASASEEGGR
jgi:antitoxin component of MazEF toxin-antitoxin module